MFFICKSNSIKHLYISKYLHAVKIGLFYIDKGCHQYNYDFKKQLIVITITNLRLAETNYQ